VRKQRKTLKGYFFLPHPVYGCLRKTHNKVTEHDLPYGIIQFYLQPDRNRCPVPF